jgi:hypothetical protein
VWHRRRRSKAYKSVSPVGIATCVTLWRKDEPTSREPNDNVE